MSRYSVIHLINDNQLNKNINQLVYGIKCLKYNQKQSRCKKKVFFIHDDDIRFLQWFSDNKKYNQSRILLTEIDQKQIQSKYSYKSKDPNTLIFFKTSKYNILLEFSSESIKKQFEEGLRFFINKAMEIEMIEKQQDQIKYLAKNIFLNADSDGNKKLDISETGKLLQELHIFINEAYLQQVFTKYDQNQNGFIEQEEFIYIMREISQKQELQSIFDKYSLQGQMSVEQYMEFLVNEQKEKIVSKNQIQQMFENICIDKKMFPRKIDFYQFSNLIFNEHNLIMDPIHQEIHQDMDRPLTDYFINSSHNTYLMSNQLTGQSSLQAYINAFQKGCKCVELDCWDGSNGEPIVYHGYTLTSKLLFKDIVNCVKEYAFKFSQFPVILSLENHCSIEYQKKMAFYLKEILKEQLYLVPPDWEQLEDYKTPNQLKNMIIVKNKGKVENVYKDVEVVSDSDSDGGGQSKQKQIKGSKTQQSQMQLLDQAEYDKTDTQQSNQNTSRINNDILKNNQNDNWINNINQEKQLITLQFNDFDEYDDIQENIQTKQIPLIHEMKKSFKQDQGQVQKDEVLIQKEEKLITQNSCKSDEEEKQKKKKKSKEKIKESIELLRVTTMFGTHIKITEKNQKCWYVSSIDEHKIEKLLGTKAKQLIDISKKQFIRVYPAGLRIDSSNYDPINGFLSGSQITALNFQTNDFPLFIYLSMFSQNGGFKSGYVLKPKYMLKNAENPLYPVEMNQITKKLKINIISASQLSTEKENSGIIDPYVEITVWGSEFDRNNNQLQSTNYVKQNGFHPVFDENEFKFQFACPEIALIIFTVKDCDYGKDQTIAQYAIPVNSIRQGYRVIPLRNLQFKTVKNSFILAHIQEIYF